jgi:DNA-binding NtrC family response regulator
VSGNPYGLSLPAAAHRHATPIFRLPASRQTGRNASTAAGMKILVVDDNREVWARLIGLLGEGPLPEIAYAADLAQARAMLERCTPELVVLETRLPDGSGLSLLNELRATRPGLPVAMFSNHPELSRHALAQGACCFFDKSLDFPELLTLLQADAPGRDAAADGAGPASCGGAQ